MRTITLEELLEAGCHFGHQVTRQNPKARDFVFEARDGIHIIDLAKTKEGLEQAAKEVKAIAAKGGTMILVGTKRQADTVVKEEADRARAAEVDGLYYVTNRWIGGTLTNYAEVLKNYKRLKDLTSRLQDPTERAKYKKKEIGMWEKEKTKLESFYSGIADITRMPDALFIIDTHNEHLAVHEAHATRIKTIGIVDTNADPDFIDFPIPANDDAVGSIKLITNYIVDAWIEGRKKGAEEQKEEVKQEEKKEVSSTGSGKEKAAKKSEEKVEMKPAAKKTEKKVAEKAEEAKEPKKVAKKSTK